MKKATIEEICNWYKIENYLMNQDGSIDVDGNVDLSSRDLTHLPLRFRRIMGHFNINNNQLITLYGGPIAVGGNFNCFNNELIDFKGAPKWIGGDFYSYFNKLTSLKGSPDAVAGNYFISGNAELSNLAGCTRKIGGDFSFDDTLISTFSDEADIEFLGVFFLNETYNNDLSGIDRKLPIEIIENLKHLKLILKYQRYFQIWNDDLSFNVENWEIFIAEINEGLQ